MELYKEIIRLKKKCQDHSYIEIVSMLIKKYDLDMIDVVNEIKKDKSLYNLIYSECQKRGLLKNKQNNIDLIDLF